MNKKDCIFCKIVKKEITSSIFYEDKKFIGFLDINPTTKGHSLLIPKEHYPWIHQTPDQLISKIFIVSKKLIKAMIKGLNCDYVQVMIVGKDVSHFHIHLIPRRLKDKLFPVKKDSYKNKLEINSTLNKIRKNI
jgi:histidine triad (HIT) family protein